MKPFWVSWYATGAFTWNGPWWVSGVAYEGETATHMLCAAVMAESEDDARAKLQAAQENPTTLRWRFSVEKPEGWEPFCERFPRSSWMRWPWPEVPGG